MDFVGDVPLDVIHVITQDIATHVKMDIIYLIINVFNAIQIEKTCSNSDSHCNSCNEGYYLSSNSNSSNCLTCIDNYFLVSNTCYKCNKNCKSTSDGCKCSNCYNGYYLSNYQCFQCNSNCKTCSDSETKCLSCYNGYGLTESNICVPCSQPCKKCSAANICSSCIDNYYLASGTCYKCNINCKTKENDNCKCAS